MNTLTEKTLEAYADHGSLDGDAISGKGAEAQAVFDRLTAAGIDLTDVFAVLEREGVDKFEKSWEELLSATTAELDRSR